MNRVWTYRGRTQENAGREAFLFFFANVCGIGITQFCLLFTHHILGLNSPLADNISAYVVGFALERLSASFSITTSYLRERRTGNFRHKFVPTPSRASALRRRVEG